MGLLGHCFNWAFLGEFSGLLFKKENIEDRNKVAVVGCRRQEFGWIQEGVKMICGPFLLSDHLKCGDYTGNQLQADAGAVCV